MASPINQTTARQGFTCRDRALADCGNARGLHGHHVKPNPSIVTSHTKDENPLSPISHLGFDHVK